MGFFFSCCCQAGQAGQPCNCFESVDSLLTGAADCQPNSARHPDGLITLEIQAAFGSGAAGSVEAPRAASVCDCEVLGGAITSASVTAAGSGYAKLGRVAPTLSASVAGGSGATLNVSVSKVEQLLYYWEVSGVTVTAGGSGYADGAVVTFSPAGGDTEDEAAVARAFVEIDEPVAVLSITSTSGNGAVLEVVWDELPSNQWANVRTAPCPAPPKKTYQISSVTVLNGGADYEQFDVISISFAAPGDGGQVVSAFLDVDSVDGNGAITGVLVAPDDGLFVPGPAGEFIGSETDAIEEVTVCTGGEYYREDATEPAIVSPVTVTVTVFPPSQGTGAVIEATVDDDPASVTFGQITALTIDDGGAGYFQPPLACGERLIVYVTEGSAQYSFVLGGDPYEQPDGEPNVTTDFCGQRFLNAECNAETVGERRSVASIQFYFVPFSPTYEPFDCRCSGALHMLLTLVADCQECELVDGSYIVSGTIGPYSYLCYRWPLDENGCPFGDAVLIARRDVGVGNEFGPAVEAPEGCGDCWDIADLVPTVSLMPP
jgi:hypothetical protein